MPSMEYQRDGSCIATNDFGDVLFVPFGPQAEMDAAIQVHVGPQATPVLSDQDQLVALAKLLVSKNVVTAKDVKDATAIDVAAVAVPDDLITG